MYDTEAIRRANPIADVVMQSGIPVQQCGQRLLAVCPFHKDRRPSLTVYPATGSYYCFGCGAGGDVIDFVCRLQGLSFKEAVDFLAGAGPDPAGAGIHQRFRPCSSPEDAGLAPAEADVIEAAVRFYEDALWSSPKALDYLADRGIAPTTASLCGLGYGRPGLDGELRRKRLDLTAARRVRLLSGTGETMLGRVVIPDIVAGRAVWLTGRTVEGQGPRYLNLRVPAPLLGLRKLRSNSVVITEGPMDWLTAVQWGIPAAALLGTRVSMAVCEKLARFRRVYLVLDADEVGREATDRLMAALGDRARAVALPSGVHDLNELAPIPAGRETFAKCLNLAGAPQEKPWQPHETTLRAA